MFTFNQSGDTVMLSLQGRLTYAETGSFAGLLQQLAGSPFAACSVDATGLEFMDSSGLRMMFSLHDLCRQRKLPIKVICGLGQPRDLLLHCRVDLLMPIEEPV